MRADLTGTDGSALLVASPDEFYPFFSEDQAYRWLQAFSGDPVNMATLRRALAEHVSTVFVNRLTDNDVLWQIARLLVRACVAIDLNELPYAGGPAAESEGEAGDNEVTEALTEMAEEEDEYEEVKPDPVIPPEFPRLAKREADFIDFKARLMGFVLDLLRYIGEKLNPESEVAAVLSETAAANGRAVEQEAGNLGGLLSSLAGAAPGPVGPSAIADSLKREAGTTGQSIIDATRGADTTLSNLLTGPGMAEPEPSAVASTLKGEARKQGSQIEDKAKDSAAAIDEIGRETPKTDNPPSEVATTMKESAAEQSEKIDEAVVAGSAVLDAILEGGGPDGEPPGSEPAKSSSVLVMEAAVAGEAVKDAAAEAAAMLEDLRPGDTPEPPPDPGRVVIKLEPDDPSLPLANMMVTVLIDGEEKVFASAPDGTIELLGVPESGFDIVKIEDGLGLEIVSASGDPPPPAPPEDASDDATDGGDDDGGGGDGETEDTDADDGAPDAPPAAAAPVVEAAPPAPPPPDPEPEPEPDPEPASTDRPPYPEESAWLKHTNRVRKARGLPLKTREDVPIEITRKAEQRRERRARRKKKRS